MDVQRINDFLSNPENSNSLTEFYHSCINEISNYSAPAFQQFVNIGWTEEEYNFVHKLTISILKHPTILYLDREKISQEFLDYQINIPDELLNCVKTRLDHLVSLLTIEHSQRYVPVMIDFDWRVKMILGSSSVASLRQPLFQLDLRIKEKNRESIGKLEMNEEELDNFIEVLESVQ